jgi:hypothetical protein
VGLWEADGARGHRQVFAWNPGTDTFEAAGRLRDPPGLARYEHFLQNRLDAAAEMATVHQAAVRFYPDGWWYEGAPRKMRSR